MIRAIKQIENRRVINNPEIDLSNIPETIVPNRAKIEMIAQKRVFLI